MSRRTWFTADTHFDHRAIIDFCGRPYRSVPEMNDALIANWNAVVEHDDTVWHLGDFGFADIDGHLRRLNGTKHLIHGNHDSIAARNHPGWETSSPWTEVRVEDRHIVLCHYAMRTWPGASNGSLHFFGHSHGTLAGNRQSCDLGVDLWNYRPVSLAEILKRLAKLPPRGSNF
jgi:calcineurin-like phosphoesterase family protein